MNKIQSIVLIIILSGCAAGGGSIFHINPVGGINPGMSISEINEIMGTRDSFKTKTHEGADYTLFKYVNRNCAPPNVMDKCDFSIIFKNGKVAEVDTFYLEGSRVKTHVGISTIFLNP
tara:strand:+ start:60 stop:413 length:354 start_codon:yes stop_codon:yes gene_type:complete